MDISKKHNNNIKILKKSDNLNILANLLSLVLLK